MGTDEKTEVRQVGFTANIIGQLRRWFGSAGHLRRYLGRQNRVGRTLYLQYRPDFDLVGGRFVRGEQFQMAWTAGVEDNNLGDLNRLYFLYVNIIEVLREDPKGALAEVGVYKGNSAKVFNMLAPERKLYLFDTFEGFDDRDTVAEALPTEWPRFRCGVGEVQKFLGGSENIVYCKGYFPDTVSQIPEGTEFAIVHLDCDLYNPIKAGLEYFYPRLRPGGLIVVHDYYSGYWPGVTRAVDEFFLDKPEALIHIPDKSGTVAVRKLKC